MLDLFVGILLGASIICIIDAFIEEEVMEMNYKDYIHSETMDLISDMYKSLQDFCENQIPDDECPMWKEEFRRCGKQCRFRDIEDKMRKLGLDDMVVE